MTEVNGIPTQDRWIELKQDTEMSTGYRGRGLQPLVKTFPKGTKVHYTTSPFSGRFCARSGEAITHWHHTVSIRDGKETFSATKVVPVEAQF